MPAHTLAARLLLLTLVPFAFACVEDPGADTQDPKSDGGPDPVDGCVPGDGPATDVEATLTDIATVVRVTWSTAEPTEGRVHFTTATGARQTAVSSGTEHEALLVGNRVNTEVPFRITTDDGTEVACGEVRSLTTGGLPSDLPDLTVAIDPRYVIEGGGYTVAPIIQQTTSFVAILDSGGQYVWAWTGQEARYGGTYFNADIDLARAGIYVNEQAVMEDTPGALRHVAFDGTEFPAVDIEGGHTDFVELPDGTMASLSWEIREVEGERYLGDRLLEVDTNGATRTVWNVWDHYTPDLTREWMAGFYQPDREVLDWSHVNGLSYDATEDAYFVSMTFNESVARIERSTGQMTWVLSDPETIGMPHSVQFLGETALVFNRGSARDPDTCSNATEIRIADGEVVWSYESEECVLVPFLGSALRLPEGNTLVDWSSAGQLDEVTPTGELLWRVSLNLGAAFGFADRAGSLYPGE
ncbi:MAG: aryl-sulfate sulfotransferase [Myxococcota bacterium]